MLSNLVLDYAATLSAGAANSDAKLYDDEFVECIKRFPGQFRVDYGGAHCTLEMSGLRYVGAHSRWCRIRYVGLV